MNKKQIVSQLIEWLSIKESDLAAFLSISQKTLSDSNAYMNDDRIYRLHEVLSYIRTNYKEVHSSNYKNILENSRLVIDPNDPEEGSISLLNFIIEEPTFFIWAPLVDVIIKNINSI